MEKLISKEELYQTIFKRKSIRKYEQQKLEAEELQAIREFLQSAEVIDPEIKFVDK